MTELLDLAKTAISDDFRRQCIFASLVTMVTIVNMNDVLMCELKGQRYVTTSMLSQHYLVEPCNTLEYYLGKMPENAEILRNMVSIELNSLVTMATIDATFFKVDINEE